MASYTYAQLKAAAEHAIGGVPDSRISSGLIVNRAIEFFQNYHPWNFRKSIDTIDFTASQEWAALPADFAELLELFGYGVKYLDIKPAGDRELLLLRVHGVSSGTFLRYQIKQAPQSDETAAPTYRLEMAPAPAATTADALYIYYLRSLGTFAVTGAGDDAKVPNIPAGMQSALYELVRDFARVSEDDAPSLSPITLMLLAKAVEQDGRTGDRNLGTMRGGLVDEWYSGGGALMPHTEIKMAGDP